SVDSGQAVRVLARGVERDHVGERLDGRSRRETGRRIKGLIWSEKCGCHLLVTPLFRAQLQSTSESIQRVHLDSSFRHGRASGSQRAYAAGRSNGVPCSTVTVCCSTHVAPALSASPAYRESYVRGGAMAKAVAVEQGDRTGRSADVAEFGEPSKRTVHVLPAGADH